MMEGEEQDASTESRNSPPVLPPESPGSSVSTRLQEEYTELLKYATGMPGLDMRTLDTSGHSFQPISKSGGSSSRHTPVEQQQDDGVAWKLPDVNGEGNVNTNSIYSGQVPGFASPTTGSSFIQTDSATITDTNTNRKGKFSKDEKRTEDIEMTCMRTTIVDPTVSDIGCKLDGWLGKLKSDILAEIGASIIQALESQKLVHQKETQQIVSEKQKLEREVNRLSELVNTCEVSMCRKDTLIENLSQALGKQRDKVSMAQAFYQCKAGLADGKREKFTEQLAKQHHEKQLCQRVLKSWFGVIQTRWRQRVERICQDQAQGVCKQLCADYEDKIKCLNREIDNLRTKFRHVQQEREQYAEQVKKAFMRGVCALNMEAMSAFTTEDTPIDPHAGGYSNSDSNSQNNININNNLESTHPSSDDQPPKSLPAQSLSVAPAVHHADLGQYHSLPTVVTGQPQKSKSKQSKSKSRSSAPSGVPSPRPSSKTAGVLSHSGPLAPPMASVMVERHDPVTKQTVGKATASRFPKPDSKHGYSMHAGPGAGSAKPKFHPVPNVSQQTFRLLAGQTASQGTKSPSSPGIKVVE